jgi:hypothetical protein
VLSRTSRFLTLLFAALQFAAPAIASVAEGAFSQQVRDPRSHVEQYGQNDCTPPHAADCAVCRFLTTGANTPAAQPGLLAAAAPALAPVETVALRSAASRQGFDARGPPEALG